MSKRNIIALVLFGTFCLFVAGLIHTKKTAKLPIGSKLPKLIFSGVEGEDKVMYEIQKVTVIIWFHPDCERCQYQLNLINASISKFRDTRFFMLTDKDHYFSQDYQKYWPHLKDAPNVNFGIIKREKFEEEFGPVVNPSLFIFDSIGVLKEKLYGEIKADRIQNLIQKLLVPEQDEKRL